MFCCSACLKALTSKVKTRKAFDAASMNQEENLTDVKTVSPILTTAAFSNPILLFAHMAAVVYTSGDLWSLQR
jgi:hypothetical protein